MDSSNELDVKWQNMMLITVHTFACGLLCPSILFLDPPWNIWVRGWGDQVDLVSASFQERLHPSLNRTLVVKVINCSVLVDGRKKEVFFSSTHLASLAAALEIRLTRWINRRETNRSLLTRASEYSVMSNSK